MKQNQHSTDYIIKQPQWFEEWFNSPYYHLLYQQRNEREAQLFLDALNRNFQFQTNHQILDLACGTGRHARYLHSLGAEVTGLDLSTYSIEIASKFQASGLSFHVQDMREPFGQECYDFVLNLFTSFGYFELDNDNAKVIGNMAQSLKMGGKVIIDYLNPYYMLTHLEPFEFKGRDGITFDIKKEINRGHIIKTIAVNDKGSQHRYQEKVRLLFPEDFEAYFQENDLKVVQVFGGYDLKPFEKFSSQRMIFVGDKSI